MAIATMEIFDGGAFATPEMKAGSLSGMPAYFIS